jgi:hypothetical protein
VTVAFTTMDGSAEAGVDYTAFTQLTVAFLPGQTVQHVVVPILVDDLSEAQENFLAMLNNPTNAVILNGTAIGMILAN